MDFKKLLTDNFGVVMLVIIGLLVIAMYTGFFDKGGLFETFTKDIMNTCMDLIKGSLE